MKKLYLIISLVLCQIMAYSQTILNQQEAVSRTVSDPQAVILAPGFHAKSDVVNPFVANVGGTIVNPNNPTGSQAGSNNPSGTTSPPNTSFHDTQGNIDVNGGGQLQYSLPIALPPGIKSVAPQINLVYTSGSGNGIAGYGWSLSGVTSISRMGRTIEKDGEVRGVQLDYTDYYSFNGQKLILKSGEYGKDGAEYVTEKFSNVRIKSLGAVSGQQWQGPEYWEVTFEDGSQAWYGATAIGGSPAARTPVEYNIVKWKDAQGNYITYNYTQGNNVAIISNITWGGNEIHQKPHFNEIVFSYKNRELKEQSYLKDIAFVQNNLLDNIQVLSNSAQFKRYEVIYNPDSYGTKYEFVSKIIEKNSLGDSANAVDFGYDESKTGGWKRTHIGSDSDPNKLHGDFDGDGKIDFIKYAPASNYCARYAPIVPNNSQDHEFIPDNGESPCIEWVNEPAGLYLFSSAFDNNRPQKVFVGNHNITSEKLRKAIAINIKDSEGFIKPRQGFVIYNRMPSFNEGIFGKQDLEITAYTLDPITGLIKEEYKKLLPGSEYDYSTPMPVDIFDPAAFWTTTEIESVMESDLDSDGLSELIFTIRDTYYRNEATNPNEPSIPSQIIIDSYRYLILSPNDSNLSSSLSTQLFAPSDRDVLSKFKHGDFNGDGKPDFLRLDLSKNPTLITFNKINSQFAAQEAPFYSVISPISGRWENAVTGDFNGDGKTDILVPDDVDSWDWKLYISTGKNFKLQNLAGHALFKLNDFFNGTTHDRGITRQFFSQDLNKDGKADFIEFYSHIINEDDDTTTKFIIKYQENKGVDAQGNVVFTAKNIDNHTLDLRPQGAGGYKWDWYPEEYDRYVTNVKDYATSTYLGHYSPIIGSFRVNNQDESILIFQGGSLIKYSHYEVPKSARITSITQGGLTTQIDYKELDPSVNQGLYASVKAEQYPFMELDRVSQSYVVSQLRQSISSTNTRVQDFKYRGFLTHLQGKGMLGFRQTARSNWYVAGNSSTKIWSGAEIDPLNESVPIKEWSVKADDDDALIFPSNLPESNTPLLSFKSTEYKTDKLLNGNLVTSYTEAQKPNLVTAIVPTKTTTKDFKKDVLIESTIEYDKNGQLPRYYLPTKTTTDVNSGFGKTVTEMQYTHNSGGLGKDYFVGRPTKKIEKVTAYGDTKGSTEEYYYENNLLQSLIKYAKPIGMSTFAVPGVPAEGIKETYQYDAWGNVLEKFTEKTGGIDAIGDTPITITEKAQYDNKGRFVIKKTDNLGLETNIEYNDWGQITKQTDPLGLVLENTYDGWGKLLASSTNLSGRTSYTYKRETNGDVIVTEYSPDGGEKITYTNKLGQNYKTSAKGFNQGSYVSKSVQYDALGRQEKESEPYYEGETAKWNSITYDDTNFPYSKVTATSFTGKEVETSISERTTTIRELNGNLITRTKTTDALGNVISSTDKGGSINFTYNAAGQQLSASYGTNKVITKYDDWGRKTEFHDPSNGTYQYVYNIFGNILRETSPKGYKQYTYNGKGQLINQKEVSNDGTSTNKNINFSYNNKGLITDKIGTSNGKTYSSNVAYDNYGRVLASSENSNGKYYMRKNVTYDDKMRVVSYEKSLYSGGQYTKVNIENAYSNWSGALYQVKDKDKNKVLWELQNTEADGRVKKALLGATKIDNTYGAHNFLTNTSHKSIGTDAVILQAGYSFNAIKNELNTRTRGGDFNISEIFEYDDNNRLVNWTNPVTQAPLQAVRNTYDEKGRIIKNDQVGEFTFGNTTKIYQPTKMTLNPEGEQNYTNNLLQKITYNENNDPIYIDGVKGDVAFTYGLSDMRQMATYGGNFDEKGEGEFTKYYSEDGSYEVIRNNRTGQEKHILYIGGTPYESNIVYLKDFAQSSGSYRFLHKDYLGSILAISDEEGVAVEQRHFDAWGNFTHLKIGNGAIETDHSVILSLSKDLLLDRGYTSHEHFMEVGLIHMNGRLYDPLLRRFLNADENIQDMFNTQNYNKYGYVMNNPLMYNDPNGEFFIFAFLAGMASKFLAGMITAAIIGAGAGLVSYSLGVLFTGGQWNLGSALKSMFFGAVGGAASFGVGSIFTNAAGTATAIADSLGKFGTAVVQGGVHAISQGVLSLMQGQSFISGALGGVLGSWAASGFGAVAGDWAGKAGGQIFFGALAGGVGAELSGGNFWQGALTGGIVAGLNHVVHQSVQNNKIRSALSDPEGTPAANMSSVENIKKEVHGLFTDEMKKYEGKATVSIDLDTNSKFAGETIGTFDTNGGGVSTKVTFFKDAFSSNYALGKAILHEFYHVADYWNGTAANLYNGFRKKYSKEVSINMVRSKIEDRGYKFIYKLGDKTSVFTPSVRKLYGL